MTSRTSDCFLDSMRHFDEALITKKELVISREFRTQLRSLKGEGGRVRSFLLCRWNYERSLVFVV